jgi:tRNA pseudouridine32 synthase/23S rRNA pseudouridine746 synthase
MQWLGHPIRGDDFYAPNDANTDSGRLMLHAERLGLYHPMSNNWMEFTDMCPF